MMSDGDADYPSKGVERILQSPCNNKIKFKAIAYGKGTQTRWFWQKDEDNLSKIAQALGGSSQKLLEPNQL
jgi:hypothetical protein